MGLTPPDERDLVEFYGRAVNSGKPETLQGYLTCKNTNPSRTLP